MYEFEIRNKLTGETAFLFGYSWDNAFSRHPDMNPTEWTEVFSEYID